MNCVFRPSLLCKHDGVLWRQGSTAIPYPDAVAFMEHHLTLMRDGIADPLIWLLYHPPCYTKGMAARPEDAPPASTIPVYSSGRGGGWTYHAPSQRIVYILYPLTHKGVVDIHRFVARLHHWIALVLQALGIIAVRRIQTSGLWVPSQDGGYDKIASIGIRARHAISFHGISINLLDDMTPFHAFRPCGFDGRQVTSVEALTGVRDVKDIDTLLRRFFPVAFGEL